MTFSKNDRHEFRPLLVEIEDAPLNPLGRTVFWIIIATLTFSLIWLLFGRIDVVVTARGKVIPAGEVKTVQPLTTGVVRRILVRTGQLVEEGEVLMEIDPSDTEPELASLKADLEQADLEMVRLEAQLSGQPFPASGERYDPDQMEVQQRLYRSNRARLTGQLQAKSDEIAAAEQRLAGALEGVKQASYLLEVSCQRLERLAPVRDLVSGDDYAKAAAAVASDQSRLVTARHQVSEIRATLARLRQELKLTAEDESNELLSQLASKRQEYLYLKAKVERTDFVNTRQQIRSPVRGYLAQLQVHTIGAVVTPAERLATVVPADSPLLIKAMILNKDVGYLLPDMETAIKVDTFEFQKYGMLNGKLLQVAQDSIEDKNLGQVYEAYVQPLQTTVSLAGVDTPITTGMTVTTEFKVGRRRIIEFFVYPLIKYLDEGISVR